MSPMSECDSTVFTEGQLATTLDRKNQPSIEETPFQNGVFLISYVQVHKCVTAKFKIRMQIHL